MILAKNHPRQSSGNKRRFVNQVVPLLLMFVVLLNLQGCAFIEDLFGKKEDTTRQVDREKIKDAEVKEVEWEDQTKEEEVVREYPDQLEEEKEFYDVLCFLPFNGSNRQKGRDLYAGLKMAANEYAGDLKLRFTTFDVEKLRSEPNVVRKLLATPEFDMIIAPYGTSDVNQVVEMAKGSGATILSPWNTSASVERFDRYVQINPGIESHFRQIASFTQRKFGEARTLIIGARKDAPSVKMIQKISPGIDVFYTSNDPKEDYEVMKDLIASKNIRSVIIPSWRSADESYFLSLLSALNSARDDQTLNVFLLASWMNNDKIQYEQLRGMNLHFTSSRFLDYMRGPIQRFDDSYYRKFNYFPSEDVLYGHDLFLIASGLFSKYGFRISDQIVNFDCQDCLFRYDFVDQVDENGNSFILNDHVDIVSWKDYEYRRVN